MGTVEEKKSQREALFGNLRRHYICDDIDFLHPDDSIPKESKEKENKESKEKENKVNGDDSSSEGENEEADEPDYEDPVNLLLYDDQ